MASLLAFHVWLSREGLTTIAFLKARWAAADASAVDKAQLEAERRRDESARQDQRRRASREAERRASAAQAAGASDARAAPGMTTLAARRRPRTSQRLVRAGPMTALADAALDTTFSSPDEVEELVPREEPKPPEGGGGAALVSREAASSDIEHV